MGMIRGATSADIDAPIADVYAVCADQATAPEWQDGLQELRILERARLHRLLCLLLRRTTALLPLAFLFPFFA